jgi:hypothetical protein
VPIASVATIPSKRGRKMKTNEYTRNDFETEVLESYKELIEKAANIGVNVTDVITQIYEKNGNWEIDYTVPKVQHYLEKVLEQKSAKPIIGILVGFSDVKGKNIPVSAALITPTGNKEVRVGWSTSIKKLDGSSMSLVSPAMVEGLIIEKENDYGKQLWISDITNQVKLSSKELLDNLVEMKSIRDPQDVLEKGKTDKVVITKFKIRRIMNPSKKEGEERTSMPIWQKDDTKGKEKFAPVLTINGVTEDGISITAYIGAPHLQRKYLDIPQIDELCKSAADETPEPEEQASYIEGMLRNREIIIIGRLFAIDKEPTERNNGSMMMSVFGAILVPTEMKIKSTKVQPQQTFETEEEETEEIKEEPKKEPKDEPKKKEPERSPVEIAVREKIVRLVNMRAQKVVKEEDRAEWLKKITDEDMIEKIKVGQITIDGKKKNVKKEIVLSIIEDMRGNNDT